MVNKDGRTLNVPVGTRVILPIYAIMVDENHYKNANKFEPERFMDGGLKMYKDNGLFYGFGDGPRVCLGKKFEIFSLLLLINVKVVKLFLNINYFITGMRFALTQIKAAMVEILRNFKIHVNPKTRTDNKLNPTYFLLRLDGDIWLDFEKIN